MKKNLAFIVLINIILSYQGIKAQITISPNFYGQNYWMPNRSPFTGALQSHTVALQTSGAKIIRVGGKDYDEDKMWSNPTLLNIIDEIRSWGMTPLIQVPINPSLSIASNATLAADIVNYVNNTFSRNVEFWEIGNEPDGSYTSPANNTYSTNAGIAAYTRSVSAAMKAVAGQSSIKIIGPSLSYYDYFKYADFLGTGANSIVGTGSDGPFIDYIAFNTYPFDKAKFTDPNSPTTHQDIVDYIQTPSKFASVLNDLNSKIAMVGRSGNLKIMITEANISYNQNNTNTITSGATGVGPGSFVGGQFWAEMMAVSMQKGVETLAFWSIIEGTAADQRLTDIGYISSENNQQRSSYHHYKMMANHFTGTFFTSTVTGSGNVKAWAAKSNDRIAVMIQNQNTTGSLPFKVRLNPSAGVPATGIDALFSMPGLSSDSYTSTFDIENQSTVVLLFNCSGIFSQRYDYTIGDALASQGFSSTATGTTLLSGFSFGSQPCVSGGSCTTVSMSPSTYTYSWYNEAGPVNYGGHTVEICSLTPTISTIYTFTVKDTYGCTVVEKLTSGPDCGIITGGGGLGPFTCSVISVTSATCGANNGSAWCISADYNSVYPGPSFSWDNGGWVDRHGNYPTNLAPGMHTVIVKDAIPSATGPTIALKFYVPVKESTKPPVWAGFDITAYRYCSSTLSAYPDLTLQGYYHYEWYKGNSSVPFSTVNPVVITNWSSEQYRVKVIEWTNGCSNWDTVNVRVINGSCHDPRITDSYAIPCDPAFNATYRSAATITTETLTANLVINRDHYLDRVLVVPEGFSLRIEDCELACASEASIIVQPGGTLKIIKTYMHPCDNYPWGGVVINGANGGSNGQQIDTIEITESVIRNPGYAIRLNQTCGALIYGNIFVEGTTGISLNESRNFHISYNRLHFMNTGIQSVESPQTSLGSVISDNLFDDVEVCLSFSSDDHSNLDIACNRFNNYADYAIYSDNTTLKDQGDANYGAGNIFISNSQNTNHQLRHNGNPMVYNCDATQVFTLSQSGGLTAGTQVALSDLVCPESVFRQSSMASANIGRKAQAHDDISFQAFPNPFSDQLNIVYELPGDVKKASVIIYEPTGRMVLARQLDLQLTKMTIEGLQLSNGVYICSIVTEDGRSRRFKLISIR